MSHKTYFRILIIAVIFALILGGCGKKEAEKFQVDFSLASVRST